MDARTWTAALHKAARNYRRDFLDCVALLAARTAERDELRDELTVALTAHYELARDFDRQRDQLRAVQAELAQRATRTLDAGRLARDEADARWKAARDRLTAAEHEVELARWDEDAARQDADEAHRAVQSGPAECRHLAMNGDCDTGRAACDGCPEMGRGRGEVAA